MGEWRYISTSVRQLPISANVRSSILFTMMMEAITSSETFLTKASRRHIPEDRVLCISSSRHLMRSSSRSRFFIPTERPPPPLYPLNRSLGNLQSLET
jgi:hypothetical protein